MNVTLSEVRHQIALAAVAHEDSLREVCRLAEMQPQGRAAVAELNGYHRELEALHKLELQLIASGKPSAPEGSADTLVRSESTAAKAA